MHSFPRGIYLLLAVVLCSAAANQEVKKQKEGEGVADEAPEKPQNLRVFPESPSAVMVVWDKPFSDDDVDHYLVYVENENMEDTTTFSFYVWQDLQACKNYTFGVRAVSSKGDVSEPALGEGVTETEVPPAPKNLHVVSFTCTTITVAWDNPDTLCPIDTYYLYFFTEKSQPKEAKLHSNIAMIASLIPNTTYTIIMYASNSAGDGPWSTIHQTTASDCVADEAPEKPQNLQVFPESPSVVMVVWDKPFSDDDVDHYLVYVENENMEDTTTFSFYVWQDLQACKNYTFGVRAVSSKGDVSEPALGEGVTETEVPPAPKNLHVVNFTCTTITVAWDNPDTLCPIDTYYLYFFTEKSQPKEAKLPGNIATIVSLIPNTTYTIIMYASNSAGDGPWSIINQTTASDCAADGAPEKPQNVHVFPESPSVVMVVWDKPSSDDDVDHYFVFVENEDMEDTTTFSYYIWQDLQACKNYTFGVRAVLSKGEMSEPALGEGVTEVEVPPAPKNLHVVNFTSTTITLAVDKLDTLCPVDGFNINLSAEKSYTREAKLNNNTIIFTDLTPNTTYIITMNLVNSAGAGPSATVHQTTAADFGGPPHHLVAKGIDSSAISVSWYAPYTEPLYYLVRAPLCMPSEEIVYGLTYLIKELDACQHCDITVTSYYNDTLMFSEETSASTTDCYQA